MGCWAFLGVVFGGTLQVLQKKTNRETAKNHQSSNKQGNHTNEQYLTSVQTTTNIKHQKTLRKNHLNLGLLKKPRKKRNP